jgi:hypothetical protein
MPSARLVSEEAAGADRLVAELVERVEGAGDGPAAREAYREGFARLRARLQMYPAAGRPSATFASAAGTTTTLAASCLPLGVAVAMHLYPLCVLQSMPLPRLSLARVQRALLLRTIRRRALVLANAGGERVRGSEPTVVARKDGDAVRVDGTFEYMSLATVADVVLFKAPLVGGGTVLCAADLAGDSVHIGGWRFSGSMRLSDTSPVTFTGHRVPSGRHVVVADDEVVRCTSDYQRCWFQLLLADAYLARLERLHRSWGLTRSADQLMSLNELAQLRQYALRLLDDRSAGSGVEPLKKATSAMKLRVSRMAQAAMGALGELAERTPADAARLRADAAELGYIRRQPTADEIILRSIGVPA